MILAIIQDPHVFCGLDSASEDLQLLLQEHLTDLSHGYLVIVDDDGILGAELLNFARSLSPRNLKLLEIALSPNRLVRLPVRPGTFEKYQALVQRKATAVALSLDRDGIDAVITDKDGKAGSQLLQCSSVASVLTVHEFRRSVARHRLRETCGGVPTHRISGESFSNDIMKPLLRWAKRVEIFDRYLLKACLDDRAKCDAGSSGGPPIGDSQWACYRRTLSRLYRIWETSAVRERDAFVLITKGWREKRGPKASGPGVFPGLEDQCMLLAKSLALGPQAEVHFIQVPPRMWNDEHDRYLVTDSNFIVSVTRGFDLIRSDESLLPATVSLLNRAPLGERESTSGVLDLLQKSRRTARCVFTNGEWKCLR